ncbi:hypothetical protein OQZ33_12180 [Pedobacter sp. MC2016-05]|uniref:hypothetical protein n=1 Tax=Pedobacter sp. MC2016-05 TaxID=2994474 RepID=UPI0022459CC6|nr:hypothetical protein [Pedobacter sp. MC2016-05]MCX2475086.1 hypothetical protein [Pedobacter sp. MC2016-05]
MNVLDFKKHMNYGRAINQLSSLKGILEQLENVEANPKHKKAEILPFTYQTD